MKNAGASRPQTKPEAAPETFCRCRNSLHARGLKLLICSGSGEPLYHADCADVKRPRGAPGKKESAQQADQLAQLPAVWEYLTVWKCNSSTDAPTAQARPRPVLVFVRTIDEAASS